jgi:malate synthase
LLRVPSGEITDDGLRHNIRVGIQYIEAWLGGLGCVPLYNLMEDAATAEICRSQIWQWIRHGSETVEGNIVGECFEQMLVDELQIIEGEVGKERFDAGSFDTAAKLFSEMVRNEEFDEFLTLPAYDYLP